MIGVESDYAHDGDKSIWQGIEAGFLTAFVIEIILKLIGFGSLFFTDGWNIFDFGIVGISVVELVMTLILGKGSSGLSSFRMLRIFRIVRVINFVARLNLLVQENMPQRDKIDHMHDAKSTRVLTLITRMVTSFRPF